MKNMILGITLTATTLGAIQGMISASKELKNLQNNTQELSKEFLELSKKQEKLKNIDEVRKKYVDISKEYINANKRLRELKEAYNRTGKSNKELSNIIKQQEKEVQKLNKVKLKQKEIFEKTKKSIELESGSLKKYKEEVSSLEKKINKANETSRIRRLYSERANNFKDKASKNFASAAKLASVAYLPVKTMMDIEEAQADLKKIVTFETKELEQQFNSEIKNISLVSPLSQVELYEIAGSGAQAGIAREELIQYTKDAQRIKVAFDLSTESAGEFLAKTRSQLGLNQKQVMEYADTINYLSDNTASKASELVDISQRVANLGGMAGVSKEAVLGFGATLVSVGQTSEQASTGLKNLYSDLMAGNAATKAQKIAFELLGLDAVNISKRMTEDGEGTILKVLTRIKQLPKELQASTVKRIFGQEALTSITNMVENLDLLSNNLELAKNKSKQFGSVDKEFQNRINTLSSQFKMLYNSFINMIVPLAEALRPVLESLMNTLKPIIDTISKFIKKHPQITSLLVSLYAGTIAFKVGMGIYDGFAFSIYKLILLFLKLADSFTLIGGLAKSVILKIASGLTKSYSLILKVGKSFKWMGSIAKMGILKIASGLKILWGFMMANPIVLIIAGIVAVVVILVVLYKKCKWFRNGVNKMWAVIKKSGIAAWKNIKIYFSYVVGTMKIIFITMVNHFKSVFKVFYYFFTGQWRKIPGELKNIWNNAVSGVKAFVELIKNTFGGFFSWFGEKWEGLKNGIKSLGSKLNPFNWAKNYTGTNYWQGGLTTVAERGAELIKAPGMTPLLAQGEMLLNLPKGTSILNNSQTRSSFANKANSLNNKLLSSNKGSGISIGGDSITINVSGENPRGIAKEIERVLRERDNRKLRVGIV